MKSGNILSIHSACKSFGPLDVITDLSFSIEKKQRLAILAPSGSGKSTLINILSGLETLDRGNFTFNGVRPVTIFQQPRLFNYMTVEENILLPFHVQKKKLSPELKKDYFQWLEVCDLVNFKHHYPYQLSGGMKQKVNLIRGLLSRPAMVLMDEPFQSINLQSKYRIIQHLLKTNPGISLLMATHNLEEIPWLAHACLVFNTTPLGPYERYDASDFSQNAPEIAARGTLQISNPFITQFIPQFQTM